MIQLTCNYCKDNFKVPKYEAHRRNCCSRSCSSKLTQQKRRNILTGKQFNHWTVLEEASSRSSKNGMTRYWLCQCTCGTVKEVEGYSLTRSASKSCGCIYRGDKSANWKGGKSLSHGYVLIKNPDKTKYGSANRIGEHRMVMADALDRPLYDNENVHHMNGNRADNRLENLELWIKHQPPGQRVEDLLEWAEHIIERYSNG